mmetsp:Transcript_35290/g.91721  ORF Transcript_35290/g.91721 Transcript_35290/m.91721 type:complete len:92 (+) Transcript_35290:653-928(+)
MHPHTVLKVTVLYPLRASPHTSLLTTFTIPANRNRSVYVRAQQHHTSRTYACSLVFCFLFFLCFLSLCVFLCLLSPSHSSRSHCSRIPDAV